ncbi:hypothetical protein APHAL10511_000648 [Amanita phalloides]|nr:hypothetical protein APHAL10511_000648 [Amanita phalloides]
MPKPPRSQAQAALAPPWYSPDVRDARKAKPKNPKPHDLPKPKPHDPKPKQPGHHHGTGPDVARREEKPKPKNPKPHDLPKPHGPKPHPKPKNPEHHDGSGTKPHEGIGPEKERTAAALDNVRFARPWLRSSRFIGDGMNHPIARQPKSEGTIAAIFTSLSGEEGSQLPIRFSDLKKSLWKDELVESWRQLLQELEEKIALINERGTEIIPQVEFKNLKSGLSDTQIANIKEVGTVLIKGGISQAEALSWKADIQAYAALNKDQVKGFPPDNIQAYELYNTPSQITARTHPNAITTQEFLLSLWHKSDPSSFVDLSNPISYFDRLRIRQPGDNKFALGPHVDGGSVEHWEDPEYRSCFKKILQGGSDWRSHDPFDASPRINARHDLYNVSNKCSIFRAWQGWTSMSSTGPTQGTLKVFPNLLLGSAYIILRPFFRPRSTNNTQPISHKFEDWTVNLDSPDFPGSIIGNTQELNEKTHPHLDLARTIVSIPKVEPGDQAFWHCDVIHAVEGQHRGTSDSSVLYIPAVPLTVDNARYLRQQRENFIAGLPAPDFPGGKGESECINRATTDNLTTSQARRMLGVEPFVASPDGENKVVVELANKALGL